MRDSSQPTCIFGTAEIDDILSQIDTEHPLTDETETTITHGPFAVFAACSQTRKLQSLLAKKQPPSTSTDLDVNLERPQNISSSLLDRDHPPDLNFSQLPHARSLDRDHHSRETSPSLVGSLGDFGTAFQSPTLESSFQAYYSSTPYSTNTSFQQNFNWSPPKETTTLVEEDDVSPSSSELLRSKPRSVFLSTEDCFLMQHYMQKVVRVFCVIDNPKSPWRALHLPRALQSCGELGTLGATSNTRKCLLHALLSISAYSLANNLRLEGQILEVDKWLRKAMQLRYKAIALLRDSVKCDLHSKSRPKYKELLAAMLSMISIDVASGDTGTCGVHLKGCEQLIRSARKSKMKYSGKARALHRIFFYLRTIHASTTINTEDVIQTSTLQRVNSNDSLEGDQEALGEMEVEDDSWLDMREGEPKDMASCEYVYGVPQSLLVLMRKAVRVVQHVSHYRRKNPGLLYSANLARLCDEIDEEILDWPIEQELSRCSIMSREDDTTKTVEHQTRAFHDALVLYFSQHVRLMHHRHLKPYVESVLYHLEAFDTIRNGSGSPGFGGALFWPAFIAASEAFDPALQARFMAWFERAKSYGLHSLWGGNAIALEVWNKDSPTKTRITSQWRTIAEERQVELMLT
ncbi:arginine metabolism regulation protein II [Exophiala oligosperma]